MTPALARYRRQAERARYEAARAERRYRAVDPENRLVARGLEAEWEHALQAQADAETELARREQARPARLTGAEHAALLALGGDLHRVLGRADDHRQGPQAGCCARCWKKSPSPFTATRPRAAPTCCCGGKAARSAS